MFRWYRKSRKPDGNIFIKEGARGRFWWDAVADGRSRFGCRAPGFETREEAIADAKDCLRGYIVVE